MMNRLKARLRSDRGDSVLVVFLLAIPLFVLTMGFVVDTAKSVNADRAYASMAQTAVETGVKSVNSTGSLGNQAVSAFVREYRTQYGLKPDGSTAETQVYNSEACSTAVVNGVKRKMPYIVVTLGTERGAKKQVTSTWIIEGNGAIPQHSLNGNVYRVISADVYTTSTNFFGVFGLPACQTHKSSVSAVAFGSNSDLK